jgi:hypothetical protein
MSEVFDRALVGRFAAACAVCKMLLANFGMRIPGVGLVKLRSRRLTLLRWTRVERGWRSINVRAKTVTEYDSACGDLCANWVPPASRCATEKPALRESLQTDLALGSSCRAEEMSQIDFDHICQEHPTSIRSRPLKVREGWPEPRPATSWWRHIRGSRRLLLPVADL